MADARTALLQHFENAADDDSRQALQAALAGTDVTEARKAVKDNPADVEAIATIVGTSIVEGAPAEEVVETAKSLAQRAPRGDEGNDAALLCGTAIWRISGDAQSAEPYFRRVRRGDASNPQVLAFYRDLFGAQDQATQLLQVLVQARRASDEPTRRLELAQEMATLAEERIGSPDRAIEVWRSVIREDGYDERAAAALSRLYRDGGKWTALVDLLKEEQERIAPGSEHDAPRIAKLLEIAELYRERLKLDTMALATLQKILEIDPRHEASLQALAETYAGAGRFNDLLGVYQRRIEAAVEAGDTAHQVQLLRSVAEIWMDKLGNPQRALEPLSKVRELAPDDAQARDLLARIHEKRRDWRALINLRREELVGKEGDAALALRVELAQVAEQRLGDRNEAIAAWNEVLVEHGDVAEAIDALVHLYERESRWPAAAELLHRKIGKAERGEAITLLSQLGSIYSDRLHDRADAVKVWSELLRLSPGHDRAIRRLRDAYVAEGHWDELVALYKAQGRIVDVVDVLQSAADRVSTLEERVALYRRVAALCADELGQPERALKALERTLSIQPDNVDVARQLVPIYREQANWARLMSTYEVLLSRAETDDERLEVVENLQHVAEHELGSPALTLQWAAAAYRLRPADEDKRGALEAAAERADGWDELVRIFETRIADESVADTERLMLLDKLALIARDRLFKPDDAQRYFRRIIAIDPKDARAMSALEEIYSTTRRWDDLAEVYRRRLDVTEDVSAKLDTLRALARLHEQHLGDLDQAIVGLQQILEIEPDDVATLDSLARIHRTRGNWGELATILERQLQHTTSTNARVPLMFELAQLRATRLSMTDEAIAGFLGVLELEPTHRPTVDALEALRQAEPGSSLPIMRGLLPYYRRVADRVREAEAMEVIVAAEEDPATRRELLAQLATTYEQMEDRREDALRIRTELFIADPSDWDGRTTLRRLGGELGRTHDVSAATARVLATLAQEAAAAEEAGEPVSRDRAALRRDLLLEHGATLRDQLGRPREAEDAFREVLDADETHQGAYEALETLLRDRSANEELVALYRRRVDVTFNQREQRELLSRMTDICRSLLGDRAAAIATAEELLDLIPDDLATIRLLAEMYAEGSQPSDYQSLEEIVGRWAELVDDAAERRRLMVWRGQLRMDSLSDPFGAVDMLGQVVRDDADNVDARVLLERLLDDEAVQLQACSLLEPIYAQKADHEGRIRVLSVRRQCAQRDGATDMAVTHLISIARIYEHDLGDAATAFEAMRQAYMMDPRRIDTREEVERLGLSQGRAGDLVEVWRAALDSDAAIDPALRIDLVHRICVLLDEHLRDQEGARVAYGQLLALDPPDASLAHKAVEALCRLHLEAGDGVALIEAKRQLLRFTDSHAAQVRIRLEIADIQEQLGDRVGGALTYSEVLDMQPDNLGALEALERLFLEEGEWVRLCEVLEHRIEVTPDPRMRAPVWRQIGEIQRDQLGDPHRAISAFQSVLDLKVGREETAYALQALVGLNEKLERWADVEDGLRRLVNLSESDAERLDLMVRTATVLGKHLSRGRDALALLKRVLDVNPRDPRARGAVAEYLEQDDTWDQALKILMPLYEEEQNWSSLLELEELHARRQPSGRRRLQALLRVAKTQEERIGDPERAFGVLCEALTEAADQPELVDVLERVERLGDASGRSEELFSAFGRTVNHILDAELQQRVLRSMGMLAYTRLSQLDEARNAYERVLEHAPADDAANVALEEIYRQQEDAAALAKLLLARADRVDSTAERDDLLVRAAELYRVHLSQPEEALALYDRLSSEGLQRADVQDVMEPLLEETGRFSQLATLLGRKLASLEGRDAVDTHLRLGRLYGQQLQDPEEGMRHLSTALRMDPDHAVATDELGRYLEDPSMRVRAAEMLEPVFAAVGDWERLIQIQEIRLAEAEDSERVRILLRIAQIEEEQLEDLDKAFESYTRVFREQPGNQTVRDQLGRLAGVLSRLERYAELLTEYVVNEGAADDSPEILAIARDAADLWAGSLRQPERAVPLLTRIREADPDDGSVFVALESALTQAEMWPDLLAAYWREIDNALDEDRQMELLRRAATLAQELLEDPNEAGRAFQRMLELRPDSELARTRLENIYETTERWPELVDLLRDRVPLVEGTEAQNGVYARIADVQARRLEDPDGAVDTIETMLAQVQDDPEAVVRLEGIAEAHRALRPRTLAILRPIYERQGNVRRLVEVDEWQLGHTEDPTERHGLYREMAALLQRTGDHNVVAFQTLCRALAEPGPEDALRGLDAEVTRVADVLEMQAALADAVVAAADSDKLASDEDRRIHLLNWGARLLQKQSDFAASVDVLQKALDLRAEDDKALSLMDAAAVALGDHERLDGVLVTRATIATDDDTRVQLLRRRAQLLSDVLVRDEDAEGVWKEVLELRPSDREALERLTARYQATAAAPELAEILERRIDTTDDEDERRDLRLQLSNLQRDALQDRAAQIDTLRNLLVERPQDDEALALVAEALIAEERHAEAVDAIVERAQYTEDVGLRADLMLAAARVLAGPLADVVAALERYESVLSLAPGHDEALSDLVTLAKDRDHFEVVGDMVRPHLEQAARWAALDEVLVARAEATSDPVHRAEALQRLADVRLQHLGDVAGAHQALDAMAAAAEPEQILGALEQAGRLAVQLDEASAYVDRLAERSAESGRDPAARVHFANYAAYLAEEIGGDAERALQILAGMLADGFADESMCEHIERLAESVGNLELVEAALREWVRQVDPGSEQATLLVRLGHACARRGKLDAAMDAYRDAFDQSQDPGAIRGLEALLDASPDQVSPHLLDALENAYQATGDKAGLARVVRQRIDLAEPLDRAPLLERLGGLYDDGGGSADQAMEAWGSLLAIDPESVTAVDRVLQIGRDQGQVHQAAQYLLSAIEAAEEAEREHASLSLRAAQVVLDDLGDGAAAVALVEPVLGEQPDHPDALRVLVDGARRAGDAQGLHAALTRAAGANPDPQRAAKLWAEAATVAEGPLGDHETALSDLEQVLANDDRDASAWGRMLALLGASGDHGRLADALGRRAAVADDADERREVRARLAAVYDEHLSRPEDAIATLHDMIADQPDDMDALSGLERILRRLERWDDVRETLENKLEVTDGSTRVEVLRSLARLAEDRLEDPADAIERLGQLRLEAPDDVAAERDLERLLVAEERWVDLSELLDARMQRQRDQADAAGHRATASRLADLLAGELGDVERAAGILSELLEMDPSYVPAMVAMAKVHEARGDLDAMKESLDRAVSMSPAGEEGAMLHLRLAQLAESKVEKREHLDRALSLSPGYVPALDAALALAREASDWARVASLLEARAVQEEDPDRRRDLILERADLLSSELGDPDGALEMLHVLYEQVQDDVTVNRRIADALFAAGRHEEAHGMYGWLAEVGKQGARRDKSVAHYLTRIAKIVMPADAAGARAQLLEAYRIDTTNVETLMALGDVHAQSSEWKDALKIYRTMLLQNADRSGLLRRGDIYVSLARAHVALEETPKARAMLRRGLEEDAEHPQLATELAALE